MKDPNSYVVLVTTKTVASSAPKPMSPFAKFRQLDKQNSLSSQSPPNSPKTPSTPTTPSAAMGPMFKFTDPALNRRAATVKDQLLQWCQMKTKEYEISDQIKSQEYKRYNSLSTIYDVTKILVSIIPIMLLLENMQQISTSMYLRVLSCLL
uniref:Uncharacterized protein n=1 Tax=Anopheles culicifacies TaxID=139723 RepID=A0A182LYK5_9DIPT